MCLPGSTRRSHTKDIIFVSSARETKVQANGCVFHGLAGCLSFISVTLQVRNANIITYMCLTYWKDVLLDSVYIYIFIYKIKTHIILIYIYIYVSKMCVLIFYPIFI